MRGTKVCMRPWCKTYSLKIDLYPFKSNFAKFRCETLHDVFYSNFSFYNGIINLHNAHDL